MIVKNIFAVLIMSFLICFLQHLSTALICLYSSLPEFVGFFFFFLKLKGEITGAGSSIVYHFVEFCEREIL